MTEKDKLLKRNRRDVFRALRLILMLYDDYRVVSKSTKKHATRKTLEAYDDFYEFLQGKL